MTTENCAYNRATQAIFDSKLRGERLQGLKKRFHLSTRMRQNKTMRLDSRQRRCSLSDRICRPTTRRPASRPCDYSFVCGAGARLPARMSEQKLGARLRSIFGLVTATLVENAQSQVASECGRWRRKWRRRQYARRVGLNEQRHDARRATQKGARRANVAIISGKSCCRKILRFERAQNWSN